MVRVLFCVLVLVSGCAARGVVRGYVMDQVDVVSNPMTGWSRVEGPGGRYSFEMPGKPDSFRPANEGGTGPSDVEVHDLRLEGNSRGYMVEVFPTAPGAAAEQVVARHLARVEATRAGAVFNKGGSAPSGARATIQYELEQSSHLATSQIFVAADRAFVLTALALVEGGGGLQNDDRRFFSSLRVDGVPVGAGQIDADYD